MPKELKSYRDEDYMEVLHHLNRIFNTCMKMIEAGKDAEFECKEEFITKISQSYENLEMLYHKKLDADSVQEINEQTRQLMF